MNGKTESGASSALNAIKWLLVAALVALGVWGNSYYAEQSVLYRVLALVALALVAAAIASTTTSGAAFWKLAKESRGEIRKVVWPTRQEAMQTTLIVVAFVLLTALILWALDTVLGWAISSVIG